MTSGRRRIGALYFTWDIMRPIVTWMQWIWHLFCDASYESFQFLLYCDPRHRAPLCVVRLVWNCHKCAMLTEPEDIWNCQKCVSYASYVSDLFASYELCDVWVWHPCSDPRQENEWKREQGIEDWLPSRLMSLGIVDCDCIHTHSWIVFTHTARPSRLVPLDSCPHTSSHSLDRHRHTYSHTWALCASNCAAVWYALFDVPSLSLETCMSAHVILMSLLSLLILMFLMFLRFLMSMCVCVA